MIWWMLNAAGRSPAGFVGGEFCGHRRAGAFGSGRTAVVESCEYRQSFLAFNPQTAVVTGIESDHFDCFQSEHEADIAFQRFMEKVADDGVLIVNAENVRAMNAAKSARCRIVRYGQTCSSSWSAGPTAFQCSVPTGDSRFDLWRQSFGLLYCGTQRAEVTLRIPGHHNVENAMAAILAVQAEGVPLQEAVDHLATFPGMRRRFEYRGTWRGADLVDDYAHHPTAISATLRTARSVYGGRRIIAVFEPHQVSRTEHLFSDFTRVLSMADECLVLPVLPARETASRAVCNRLSGQMVRRISEAGRPAFLVTNLDQVLGRLDHATRTGDVIITMGAGRTHQLHDEIHRRLQRNSAA
jgi:UDP-N-acetylmuramate--alanine ligase